MNDALKLIGAGWVALIALAAFHSQAWAAPQLQTLPDGSCKLWVPSEANTAQAWSGACRDGLAEGPGVITGVYRTTDGKEHAWRFDGRVAAGKRVGFGRNAIESLGDFQGQYRGGIANGWGRSGMPNGDVWEGQWRDGKANGLGTYIARDGTRTKARWVDDERVGVNLRQSADGQHWRAMDIPDGGTGRLVIVAEDEEEAGRFRDTGKRFVREGNVVYMWHTDRKIYFGRFDDDIPNGMGLLVVPVKDNDADASIYPGVYKDGCLWRGNWYTKMFVDSCSR
jgi:hypothetical protein